MAGYFLKGRKRYTDGIRNVTCFPGDEPEGFVLGMTSHHTDRGREILSRCATKRNKKRWAKYYAKKACIAD